MSYKKIFSAIGCKRIVIIEDDFKQNDYNKSRFLYDATRMSIEDRELYLKEIESISEELKRVLSAYFLEIDKCFEMIGEWDECVAQGDIFSALTLIGDIDKPQKEKIEVEIEKFEGDGVQEIYECGAKYGIGIDYNIEAFSGLYQEYIFSENRARSVRIYTDFSAKTQSLFAKDIEQATASDAIVCIVDNNLNGENRAEEILRFITDRNQDVRKNIIGSVFSSKEKYELISDKLYFEYTSKGHPEVLKSSIAKSAYNFFIAELKNQTTSNLMEAFDKALNNKNIAYFLAQKAQKEGASEYETINAWIKLMTAIPREDSSTIKRMICLSKVINSLDDSEELPDADLQKLNTIEAFDYTVNDFLLPVAAGDIFTNSKGEWYVLIGQDCDMARGINRVPKNAIAELLPAKLRKQTEFDKWANDLKSASIYSFRESIDDECKVLQVDYQSRQYIANEIINLCSYNYDGKCRFTIGQGIDDERENLIPEYMNAYHEELQRFFCAADKLKNDSGEIFDVIIAKEYSPRLISLTEYEKEEDTITFDLKRVCRLTHEYVFYLYKLFLEYRGRKPFQTINLIRQEETTLPVEFNGGASGLHLTFCSVPVPDKNNPKDWVWFIATQELNAILEELGVCKLKINKDEVTLKEVSEVLDLQDGKNLTLIKARKKVILRIN